MTPKNATLFVLAVLLVGLAFLASSWMRKAGNLITFGLSSADKVSMGDLRAAISGSCERITSKASGFVTANVFSRYPLNLKDQLLADAGSKDGVKPGGAAILNGVLIGKISEVGDDTSAIQTVFDPGFSLAVRIGKSGADALLKGGVDPKLTLIQKSSVVAAGDAVYSASRDFEYGLPLGVIGPMSATAQDVFSEAELVLNYSPSDLRYIFLEKR